MPKFRKKPVEIEAVQITEELLKGILFDGEPYPSGVRLSSLRAIASWLSRIFYVTFTYPPSRKINNWRGSIKTLEGNMEVRIDDWVITGVQGEHYPCKPDIFEQTYEPVSDE